MLAYLIRHGESEDNRSHRESLQGNPLVGALPAAGRCPALTALGLEQARQTGEALRRHKIEYLVVSPLFRALQTAQQLAETLKCPVEVWAELAEGFFNSRAPLTQAEIKRFFPTFKLEMLRCNSSGEWHPAQRDKDWEDVYARARVVVQRLRKLKVSAGCNVGFVTHGGMGSALVDEILALPPTPYVRFELDNCSISMLRIGAQRGTIRQLNNTAHLSSVTGNLPG